MLRAVADDLPKHFSRLLHRVGRLDRLHGLHPRHLPLLHVGLPHHGRGLKLCYSKVLRSNPAEAKNIIKVKTIDANWTKDAILYRLITCKMKLKI